MCGSMVHTQCATPEIRREKKTEEGEERRRKKKPQDENIMFASAMQGGDNQEVKIPGKLCYTHINNAV